ncbi:MAG: hypothetical protein A3I61_03465 [Acidobacteria bacterium RIFCSPLOWO2_02_FULL_68_18]|nr:MAG: hypothetical protein A3I61_03465 [Acidobacteria bacterium RIFCSPLOWO2_02_FULL_68_18]OFW48172.1 MAG: hypothetical protein A3G77_04895 [Acidobacteria bacterium RIFCSPLOWO2_12_FULL_68_19]
MRTDTTMKSMAKGLLLAVLGSVVTACLFLVPGRSSEAVAAQNPPAPPIPGAFAANPNLRHNTWTPVNGKGGQEVSGPYEVVKTWPQQAATDGWTTNAEGIYLQSPDRIISVGRGTRKSPWPNVWGPAVFRALGPDLPPDAQKRGSTVVVYDRTGKVIESWDQWQSILPDVQQVQANPYDPERHLWIATGRGVVQLTRDGKSHVNTIDAADVPQADPKKPYFVVEHFAWASNGDLFTSGGYQVHRFSKDGKHLAAIGKPGSGPGEFGVVGQGLAGAGIHGVVVDSTRNRMYVADRVNSRIQVFDLSGKFLDLWPNITAPYAIRLTRDGRFLWVADGYTMKFQKYDALGGRLVPGSTWGTMGVSPGTFWGIHVFVTDADGNLYVGEDLAFRIQKFTPRKDGNPEQLIGALLE